MKTSGNKFFKNASAAIIIFAITFVTNISAQGNPPGGADNTIDSLPLDGGLIALLIGGVAFGVKKLYDNKNDKA